MDKGGGVSRERSEHRPADELSLDELEAVMRRKRIEARQARLQRFRASGRALPEAPDAVAEVPLTEPEAEEDWQPTTRRTRARPGRSRSAVNQLLLIVEVAAVVGFVYVLASGFGVLQELNQEVAQTLTGASPQPTPLITAVVLPSGHTPPTAPGGAQPNDAEIPEHLRPLAQSYGEIVVPTPGPEQARSIFIPALWNDAAPVVQGDGWEQLKKGVGQHVGSVNPGQAGNVVLSAHNDIYGELFRDLGRLKPGDEITLTTASHDYLYRVTGSVITEPTDVSVMDATSRPTLTLISCYPYLVDNERIVVFAELAES
jgi:sortase A